MGMFDDELNEVMGEESRFESLNLKPLFNDAELQQVEQIISILKQGEDENLQLRRIQNMGEKGAKILLKLAKTVLI